MTKLELPKILEKLSALAVSERAKELCLELSPADSLSAAQALIEQTSAARGLIGIFGSPPFASIAPVGASLKRAELGGSLNTRELLSMAAVLNAARRAKGYGTKGGDDCLTPMFNTLQSNNHLEDKITNSIIGEDEIADAASPELAQIRRHMRVAASKIRDHLQKIISSPAYSKILQDPIITQRGDRFVVPVKAEHKADLPGLTHDVSSSGATLFIEPIQVVNANNELKELSAKERKEIERILAELSADCADCADMLNSNYNVLVELDAIFARGKLSYDMNAREPIMNDSGRVKLLNARHPLLDKQKVVPISVTLGHGYDTLIITGPNTGGKTVALKTIGLLSQMAACGLHIPADDGSETAVFANIMADIGDEQSIEQSLSTFSSHMKNIVTMLERADNNTLMLFDELGAGTDPIEGAALAVSVIEQARLLGAKTVATTHYAELKIFALTTEGVENASCEFDVETLRPTYRLLTGIPGKSNAFAISRRLGLDENIIERAQAKIGQENARFEDVISRLEEQRIHWERESAQAAVLRIEAEENAKKTESERAVMEKERGNYTQKARSEAESIIRDTKETVDLVLKELSELKRKSGEELNYQALNDAKSSLKSILNQAERELSPQKTADEPPPTPQRPLKIGDTVTLLRTNTAATILDIKNGVLTLQAGLLKVTAKPKDVRLTEEKPAAAKGGASIRPSSVTARASAEVDLRGMTTDEAVGAMEIFIDNAVMAKLGGVTVIHGKGTGAVRSAVHQALKRNKQVKSFRLGRFGEGEDGVTIVEMR
ncbi:MAG: endonuclease MutS2 [Oscillospiraceae bacterium]|nr:endonuclease MutS2 [Oscillospiraceae bacterium]